MTDTRISLRLGWSKRMIYVHEKNLTQTTGCDLNVDVFPPFFENFKLDTRVEANAVAWIIGLYGLEYKTKNLDDIWLHCFDND
jgi:hypothetical protein